ASAWISLRSSIAPTSTSTGTHRSPAADCWSTTRSSWSRASRSRRPPDMKVLGISGSLRNESHNSRLLTAAGQLIPEGVELVQFDQLRDLPHYDQDAEADNNLAVDNLRSAIAEADAVLIVTPEYN